MRFTHPELYESRDGLPMYTALYEFRRRGLLCRGMASEDIRKLLGTPHEEEAAQMENDDPYVHNVRWVYGLHASTLVIDFSPAGTALSFRETSDGEPGKSQSDEW